MKAICRIVWVRLIIGILLGILLVGSMANLWAQTADKNQRGPIGITANFGVGHFDGEGEVQHNSKKVTALKDVVLHPIRIGLGVSYAHPLGKMLSLGGFVEFHLSFSSLSLGQQNVKITFKNTGIPGFGFAVGPYFRLGLWGKDKKGGLGLSPYFVFDFLRGKKEQDFANAQWTTQAILAFGGGARVDVFINQLIGINLGFELLGSQIESANNSARLNAKVPLFGLMLYGGLTFSF